MRERRMQVSNMKNSSSIRTSVNDTMTDSERKADDLEESKTDFLNDTSDNFFDDSDFDKRSQGSSSSQSLVSFDNYSGKDDEEVAGRFISRKRSVHETPANLTLNLSALDSTLDHSPKPKTRSHSVLHTSTTKEFLDSLNSSKPKPLRRQSSSVVQDKALAELQKQSGRNLLGHGANNKRTTKVAVPKMFTPKNKGRLGGSGRRSSLDQLGIATYFRSSNGRESPEPVAKQYGGKRRMSVMNSGKNLLSKAKNKIKSKAGINTIEKNSDEDPKGRKFTRNKKQPKMLKDIKKDKEKIRREEEDSTSQNSDDDSTATSPHSRHNDGNILRMATTGEGGKLNADNQTYWTHKAIKSRGGDKARVRSTIRLDPFNVKRALDPETWETIRHMEGIVVESGNGKIHGYYSCVICEDRLIFLPLSKTGFVDVCFREFRSSGHIIMIPANEILTVGYKRGEENAAQLWGDQNWNARSLHIKLNLFSPKEGNGDKSGGTAGSHAGVMHLYTYEKNSKIMFHISNMWMNCFTRMKANILVTKEESDQEEAIIFFSEVRNIVKSETTTAKEHIHAMSFLAAELVNDVTLKRLFFEQTDICSFCYQTIKRFKNDMEDQRGSKSACLLLLRRLVCCFKLLHAALFNSASVPERYQFFYLGDTLLSHLEMYSKDFVTFMHHFEESTGFSPKKLNIADQHKLKNIRHLRKSMGQKERSTRGGISRGSLRNVLGSINSMSESESDEETEGVRKIKTLKRLEEEEHKDRQFEQRQSRANLKNEPIHDDEQPKERNDRGALGGSRRTLQTGLENKKSPRSPRVVENNKEMFHVLSESLFDYQVGLIIQLHEMNVCYNLGQDDKFHTYQMESRDSVASCMRYLGEGFGDGDFSMSTFFDNMFQRMITLIDELKSLDGSDAPTQEVLNKLELLNLARPDLSPRGHDLQNMLDEVLANQSLHRLNHPTIAMYHHARLLYNLVNDDVRTREEAKMSGEEELKNFIGSKKNLDFFTRSNDIHLTLAASFIRKSQNWMGASAGGGMMEGMKMNSLDMFDIDDEVDIE
ncbi:hypothetical protein TL16_g01136 [Triparma laevis f. inornata]|uniref:Uncharacterized protein n=1 Tax=Triparma laevis f. inornata TaxID=1714386 RepID=A0A9W6ZCP7_9STRA|nr:hypothetical protein TL16_g01136 [Triparma laevis f. inornata]